MSALTLNKANAMPASTWRHLRMNDAAIELPEGLTQAVPAKVEVAPEFLGAAGAFDAAVAALQAKVSERAAATGTDTRAMLAAVDPKTDPHNLDIPAVSRYEERAIKEEMAQDVAAAFECGMGGDAEAYLDSLAAGTGPVVIACGAGQKAQASLCLKASLGAAQAALVDVVAEAGSELSLHISFDGEGEQPCVVGCKLRVFAGEGARVSVSTIHTLGEGAIALDAEGYVLDDDARIDVSHRVLGAGKSFTGLACDLRGNGADAQIRTRYLGHGAETRDFNYIVRHRGRKTTCNLDANGVLADTSRKVLRGTIDLVHGCKGSEGTEHETVLLADEKVVNKTIPVILCDEDDVAGNHGATIGHVRPEQMNYLMTRGISQEAAERLFANATLEEAAITAPNEQVRASVARLAAKLGVPFELVGDGQEA